MNRLLSRRMTMLIWFIGYLWSVPLAIFLSSALKLQYDGDVGWWIVMAYTAPILFLMEPLGGSVSFKLLAIAYLIFLFVITLTVARHVRSTILRSSTFNFMSLHWRRQGWSGMLQGQLKPTQTRRRLNKAIYTHANKRKITRI